MYYQPMEAHAPSEMVVSEDISCEAATLRAEALIAHLDDLVRQAGERAVEEYRNRLKQVSL